jgi:hypothetical protein
VARYDGVDRLARPASPQKKNRRDKGCRFAGFFAALAILFAAWALNVSGFFGLSPDKPLSLPSDLNQGKRI